MNDSSLSFALNDTLNKRVVELKITLNGEHIDAYYEAFESFLLAAGFTQESIDRRYER